jgi:hypothetical protein
MLVASVLLAVFVFFVITASHDRLARRAIGLRRVDYWYVDRVPPFDSFAAPARLRKSAL